MTGSEMLLATTAGLPYVEIDGSGIEQGRFYTDKQTGAQKPLRGRQTGYLFQGSKYPIEVSVDIPDGKGPYRPGLYVFAGPVFEAGKFGRMEFVGMRNASLIPLEDAARAYADLVAAESQQTTLKSVKTA